MGVTVRQKEKGRGKPWWVFIAHESKRKTIRVGEKTAAEALASKIREKSSYRRHAQVTLKTLFLPTEAGARYADHIRCFCWFGYK